MVRVREGNNETIHYFIEEKELLSFAASNRDLGLFNEELTEEEILAYKEKYDGLARRAVKYELHECHAISRLLARLQELGVQTDPFFADDAPIYELIEGDGTDAEPSPVFNLFQILDRVLEIGRRGMRIQRFKGLGEMNAKELYSTTMDPATRQLLRVRLDDENQLEADTMFEVLMGDVVEPRKRFIEDNALNVQNLDV
jgi:DNA gyrase subunit B